MPQPIRRPLQHITFDSSLLMNRTVLLAELALTIAEWNKTEAVLGILLGGIMDTPYSLATGTLQSLVNFGARLDLVRAATEHQPRLTDVLKASTFTLLKSLKSASKERNGIVHSAWGMSTDFPERLIRAETVNLTVELARLAENSEIGQVSAIQPFLETWSAKCFQDVRGRIAPLNAATINLSNEVVNHLSASTDQPPTQ